MIVDSCDAEGFNIALGTNVQSVLLHGLEVTNETGTNVFLGLNLPNLTEIDGPLTITGNSALGSLTLNGLRFVGGAMELRDNGQLLSIIMNSLTSIAGNFTINSNDELNVISMNEFSTLLGTFAITQNDSLSCSVMNKILCQLSPPASAVTTAFSPNGLTMCTVSPPSCLQ